MMRQICALDTVQWWKIEFQEIVHWHLTLLTTQINILVSEIRRMYVKRAKKKGGVMLVVSFTFFRDGPLSAIVVDTTHVACCMRPVLIVVDTGFVQHWTWRQIPTHAM